VELDTENLNTVSIKLEKISSLVLTLEREQTIHRFRHHRAKFFLNLEACWAEIVTIS
jgi:hypothetical protein